MPAKRAPGASPASKVKKRLRLLTYGPAGSGKTVLALSFGLGGKVLVVDMEGSTDLYEPGLQLHWGKIPEYDVVRTKNLDDILSLLDWLEKDKGETYQTVVLEPVTLFWAAMQDVGQTAAEARAQRYGKPTDDVMLTQRDWGKIKRVWRTAFSRMVNLPVNMVWTAHQTDLMESKTDKAGNTVSVKIGQRPDSEKNTTYWPDVTVRMEVTNGNQFAAVVEKVRGPGFKGLVTGVRIPNISYLTFKPFLEQYADGEEVKQQVDDDAVAAATKTAEKILAADVPVTPDNAPEERVVADNRARFKALFERASKVGLAQEHGVTPGLPQSQVTDLLTVWEDKIAAAESQAASQAA